ncbi:SPOR domain-containing protein [Psychromonas sp. KJ10-10]|uniref:SPOR domain-containing protein n=1 Tax=Psychromonas sp. KJ10-10 TaxID=3391823 RepID=UPI0039B52C00
MENKPIELSASVDEVLPVTSEAVKTEIDEGSSPLVLEEEVEAQISQVTIEQENIKQQAPIKAPVENETNDTFVAKDILFAINPNFYTLQLAGFASEASLNRFIGQHNLPQKDVYIYQTIRNENTWYVVIYGQYESREIATTQAQQLPGSFAELSTWAKKYELVHQDLQRDE